MLAAVDALSDEMVAFTQAMVRIPTVNPPGESYSACSELIADKLREFGYAVETLPAEGLPEHSEQYPRINVVGSMAPGDDLAGDTPSVAAERTQATTDNSAENPPSPRKSPTIHFNGHYDVVPPGAGWTVDPFGGELREGRIYGRGTCDQKAGIAASIYAVEAIRRAGIPLKATVEQSATPDEESGGFAGVAWLCDVGRIKSGRQDYVVITEPLDPERVCIGHRGVYWFELTTVGRVGHGSMPGLAVNAAEQMARLIQALDERLKPLLATRTTKAPVEPPQARAPSINLNSIHAGQQPGGWQTPAVPDRCIAIFDRRFIHEESFDEVRAEIIGFLDAKRIPYELRDLMRVDPLLGSAASPLTRATSAAICDVLNVEPSFIVSPGTYDQKHVVRRAGIDACIAYGPGRLILAHQPDEYVALSDLLAAAKVLALLTVRLVG